jgi:hypothetical protein
MSQTDKISVHGFGKVEGRDRVVRWNDVVHESVAFRASGSGSHHNNPPENLVLVNDLGAEVGRFRRA